MRHTVLFFAVLLVIGAAAADARAASMLCVGGPGCFATVQAAVDAAHDGDTITIAPGTYAGGITIDVSVDVRGAGARQTVIKGGGPVVTIGQEQAATEPTVSISGVTITGGRNDSAPGQAVAQGGGVRIPQGVFVGTTPGLGATVSISDSVISGNTVAAKQLLPAGFCGPFDCSFASGGGIWSAGTLTVTNTRVTGNQAGDPASLTVVANGGGIAGGNQGSVTVRRSIVDGNRVVGAVPWGDSVNAAGIDSSGRLDVEDSLVTANSATLSTDDPTDEFPTALGGGIGFGSDASIARTVVSGNSVTALNSGGQALAAAGGIFGDGSLILTDSTISRNTVDSRIPAGSSEAALAGSGGIEVNAEATIRDSRIVANSVTVSAPGGSVGAGGGGISNFGAATLERTLVAGNRVQASAASGFVHGGGIENVNLFGTTPTLSLTDTIVTANAVSGSSRLTVEGGGLFTDSPVTRIRSVIAGNQPDQCSGC